MHSTPGEPSRPLAWRGQRPKRPMFCHHPARGLCDSVAATDAVLLQRQRQEGDVRLIFKDRHERAEDAAQKRSKVVGKQLTSTFHRANPTKDLSRARLRAVRQGWIHRTYASKKVLDWVFRRGTFNKQAISVLKSDTRDPTTSVPTSSEAENSTGHCHWSAKGQRCRLARCLSRAAPAQGKAHCARPGVPRAALQTRPLPQQSSSHAGEGAWCTTFTAASCDKQWHADRRLAPYMVHDSCA